MDAPALLAEIACAFEHVPYPGDLNIVVNNDPGYDLESLGIRDSFKAYTWQTLPDSLLSFERGGFHFMSPAGLHYYLPAYLQFCVRDYYEADTAVDGLITLFTLPAATDTVPESYWMNEALRIVRRPITPAELQDKTERFGVRFSAYSVAQSRAILHYLEYMRDEHSRDFWEDEPGVAIRRYWHQFA